MVLDLLLLPPNGGGRNLGALLCPKIGHPEGTFFSLRYYPAFQLPCMANRSIGPTSTATSRLLCWVL
jgi:hypothetical protein